MKILLQGKEYKYHDDSYLKDQLSDCIKDEMINLDTLPYEKIYLVYDYLCGLSTMLISEPFPTKELQEKNEEINSRINKVNHMQKFLKDKGKEEESKNVMLKFIGTLLSFDEEYSKYGDQIVEENNYGILR